MDNTLFEQIKHAINFGNTPDVSGASFTPEQIDELRPYLTGNPAYMATLKAGGDINTEATQLNNDADPVIKKEEKPEKETD